MATGTQDWLYALILYFTGLLIVVSLFSIGGMFTSIEGSTNIQFSQSLKGQVHNKSGEVSAPSISVFSWKSYFTDVFSFFFWDINVYDQDKSVARVGILVDYFWIVRIIIVFMPLIALLLCIWYSVPTVSG